MNKYLLAYKIGGLAVGTEIGYWSVSDLNENPPFKVINENESIPEGYTNISSITAWHNFGMNLVNDYLVGKTEIKNIINTTGWANLTAEEKDLAIHYYSFPTPTDAVIYLMTNKGYTQEYAQFFILQQWHKHHASLINSAKQRWYYVKLIVSMYLSFLDAEDLLNTIEPLVFPYTDIARFGINYGDKKAGLMDYVESTDVFTGQGLRENNYSLLVGDWDIFINALRDVLVYGIYTKYDDIKLD